MLQSDLPSSSDVTASAAASNKDKNFFIDGQQPTSLKSANRLEFLRASSSAVAAYPLAASPSSSVNPASNNSSYHSMTATEEPDRKPAAAVMNDESLNASIHNLTKITRDNDDTSCCSSEKIRRRSSSMVDVSTRTQEDFSKYMTLQSIDRLESHLPRIVVEQLISDMKQRKEEATNETKSSPLGAMTLEVPIPDPNNTAAAAAAASAATRQSVSSANTTGTTKGMSDLLNTLSSLDDLLEEEFSSSEDRSGSSDEEEEDSDVEGEHYESSDSEDDNDGDDEAEGLGMSGVALAAFDADDGISDIDDSESGDDIYDHSDSDSEDDDSSCSSGIEEDMLEATNSIRGNNSTNQRISYATRSNSGSASGSAQRSFASGSKQLMAAAENNGSEVGKLRQGRLNNRRHESDVSTDDQSQSVDLTTLSTKSEGGNPSLATEIKSDNHVSAILFLDISGFTKLSRSLEVEALSGIINRYFEMIVSEIKSYGGDILKFAGDALIVEWTKEMLPPGQQHLPVTLLAALCASKLVDKCSDHPVEDQNGTHICTLNLHCALGYGSVVGAHCGDMDRMEYLILGDSIQQIADGMEKSQLGEVVASPEAMKVLLEGDHVEFAEDYKEGDIHTLAFKQDQKFKVTNMTLPKIAPREPISELCQDWSTHDLEDLQRRMSRYVHSVVYSDEFSGEDGLSTSMHRRMSMARTSNNKSGQTQSELRDVFTVFIQPKLKGNLNDESAGDEETLQLLNSIMFIVNSEVTHYKAHLRQFIVDDKGLVVIANFGLRGSTFPNMIEERAIPCISNIKTLLKTELDLECKIGATFGKSFCGVVGGINRHEYSILGPSVNLAARLMASQSNPGILVDEAVKNKAGERPFRALPPVKAKGYDALVKIYNPKESVRKAWKNVSEEFVGRQEEIDTLMGTAKSVIEDSFASKTVFISGPYGIGKSYLLSQAAQEIECYGKAQEQPFHASRVVFCEDDSFRPFSIVRPLFLDLLRRKQHVPSFGAAETAGHSESLIQKAEVEEAQLYVSLLQICLEAKIPMQYIEMFGGLIFSTKLSEIGGWSDRNQKMFEWNAIARYLVTAFLHCTADYGLVLLALDDVSGMDEMSWKILQRLYQRASNLLVITTARNEFDLNINAEFWSDLNEEGIDSGRFRHLRVAPMKLEDVGMLATKRLGMADEALSKTVASQSRGNPLLACEILDVMYKNDESSSDIAASGAALSKIEELLLNRLDELAPLDRSHLNLGAILGFTFAEKDVVLVMERYNAVKEGHQARHAKNVHQSLQASVQFGILKCTGNGSDIMYEFSHALWMKTIALHILDAWKDEMRALIGVATTVDVTTTDDDVSIKYDWDELGKIKAELSAMREQNTTILDSIGELRALINRAR